MIRLTEQDRHMFGLLLTPSWISGLVAVTIGLIVTIGVIVAFSYQNSTVQQQLIAWEQQQPVRERTLPGEAPPGTTEVTVQSTWPLLIVWSVIGLIVYSIASSLVHSVTNAAKFKESLEFVNAERDAMVHEVVEHIILRIIAAAILGVLVYIFFIQVIPYSITAARGSAVEILSLTGVLYALLSFAMVVVSLHMQAIFLRLALGKMRIFTA